MNGIHSKTGKRGRRYLRNSEYYQLPKCPQRGAARPGRPLAPQIPPPREDFGESRDKSFSASFFFINYSADAEGDTANFAFFQCIARTPRQWRPRGLSRPTGFFSNVGSSGIAAHLEVNGKGHPVHCVVSSGMEAAICIPV